MNIPKWQLKFFNRLLEIIKIEIKESKGEGKGYGDKQRTGN